MIDRFPVGDKGLSLTVTVSMSSERLFQVCGSCQGGAARALVSRRARCCLPADHDAQTARHGCLPAGEDSYFDLPIVNYVFFERF